MQLDAPWQKFYTSTCVIFWLNLQAHPFQSLSSFLKKHASQIAVLAAFLLAAAAFLLSIFGRGIGIDQAIFLLNSQQWLTGHPLYRDIQDVHPPPIYLMHALPVLLSRFAGWPVIFCFNFIVSLLAVLSGCLFGMAAPAGIRLLSAATWTSLLLLGAHDYFFGQREYFFILAWVPYLFCHCGAGVPPRWAQIVSGVFLGFVICFKPHFLLVVVGVEILLVLRYRARADWLPFFAFISSGALQIAIFLTFFDVPAYFRDIAAFNYYGAVGISYGAVIYALIKSSVFQISLLAAILAAVPLFSKARFEVVSAASLLSAFLGTVLAVLQGTFREYFLILIYFPLAAMLSALAIDRLPDEILPRAIARPVPRLIWTLLAAYCLFIFVYEPGTGIVRIAGKRYVQGYQSQIYGGVFPDPFEDWVRTHIPANAPVTVVSPQYGAQHSDPVLSMLRLGRPVGSHTGVIMTFSMAEAAGNVQAGCQTLDMLRGDIVGSESQWVFLRREMPPWASAHGSDPLVHLRHYPAFWNWFSRHYSQSDQFGRYAVYHRVMGFSAIDSTATLPCP